MEGKFAGNLTIIGVSNIYTMQLTGKGQTVKRHKAQRRGRKYSSTQKTSALEEGYELKIYRKSRTVTLHSCRISTNHT
jgi:hypothetical protein